MLSFFKIRRPYLNLEFKSSAGITRVIERPGLWMKKDELLKLKNDLLLIVETIGIGGLNYGILKENNEALNNAIITIIYNHETKKPFAFNALSAMDCSLRGKKTTVIHLGLVVIDPNARAKGLSWVLYGLTTFLLFLKNRFRPLWISNVTQVPAIIGMTSESFGNVYPNPLKDNRRSFDHLVLAREIIKKHRHVFGVGEEAEFDEEFFVIKNAYTGGSDNLKKTFEKAPKHRNEIYNDFAKKYLNYDRGDDILQLGQMDVQTYYHYMVHNIPSGSKIVLMYRLFFNIFEFSIVPITQWFSTSKQIGSLRPRKSRGHHA